jgi:Domain of unknown function (DUF4395)
MRGLFRFPNPVNETSARLVAAGVLLQCAAYLAFREGWLLVPLASGFVARVLTGPTLSPLGQFVTRVVTPRIHEQHRFVPGPPKRFAQGIGATLSVGALIAWAAGSQPASIVLVALITVAATLESVFAVCLGCVVFNRLMKWGVIPASVCESCNDISTRLVTSRSAA